MSITICCPLNYYSFVLFFFCSVFLANTRVEFQMQGLKLEIRPPHLKEFNKTFGGDVVAPKTVLMKDENMKRCNFNKTFKNIQIYSRLLQYIFIIVLFLLNFYFILCLVS